MSSLHQRELSQSGEQQLLPVRYTFQSTAAGREKVAIRL